MVFLFLVLLYVKLTGYGSKNVGYPKTPEFDQRKQKYKSCGPVEP